MKVQLEALGSILTIDSCRENITDSLVQKCFLSVETFEKKYSRFDENTFLYTLNKTKKGFLDEEFSFLLEKSKEISLETEGYFDITLLPILENSGYGISPYKQRESTGMDFILIESNKISLKNNIQIDLGGIGKGYIIDVLFRILEKELTEFIISFGGDIRVRGKHLVGLEDPFDASKIIGSIWIQNESICSSSGQKRQLQKGHHIIDPTNKISPMDKIIIYTKHKEAIYADSYATALFASPLEKSLLYLENINGLEGMIIGENGNIYKSNNFLCEFVK